jgi:regulator of cell morphogenesis and NO signaling
MPTEMDVFSETDTVGEIVTQNPSLSRVFEKAGIDYCCGGKKSLEKACQKKGVVAGEIITQLQDALAAVGDAVAVDPASLSLTELADHIEQTHHAYLRAEFPRLDAMTKKVAAVHGEHEPRLHQIRETFLAFVQELSDHMKKEEHILFPMVRQLDASETTPPFHCGSLANPVRQMEMEHDAAGSALETFRELTDGYVPPEWACNTYRALYDALEHLEQDMHQHIHKENNVLFARALEMEQEKTP